MWNFPGLSETNVKINEYANIQKRVAYVNYFCFLLKINTWL